MQGEDVLSLPPVTEETRLVELSDADAGFYDLVRSLAFLSLASCTRPVLSEPAEPSGAPGPVCNR